MIILGVKVNLEKTGVVQVKWDIDNRTTKVACSVLRIENSAGCSTGSDDGSHRNKNKGKRKRSQVFSSAPSPVAELSSSESDLLTSESESDMEDQNINNFLDQRRDDDISRDSEHQNQYTNTVTVHGTSWEFGTSVEINTYKDTHFKPELHVRNIQSMKQYEFWMAFFPSEDLDLILRCTNAHLRERRRLITKGEFFKAIGIMYAMTINVLHSRRDYWSTESGLFPAPAFGQRFGMGLHRFEEILGCMAFAMPANEEPDDKWYHVRPFFDMTTAKWRDIFTPGYKLTIDESMFAWYGKGLHNEKDGLPAVIKIKRKPKGIGCECKTLADVQSGVMIAIEINEGKTAMQQKEFQQEFGAGTATTLRMTRPWHGSGRIVIGDSWFASAKTAIQLHKRGLYFLGIIKTATKNYPIAEARRRCPSEREGQPVKKRRTDESGRIIIKEVPRPKIVEEYFDGAPSIDIHNHIRQSGLALEETCSSPRLFFSPHPEGSLLWHDRPDTPHTIINAPPRGPCAGDIDQPPLASSAVHREVPALAESTSHLSADRTTETVTVVAHGTRWHPPFINEDSDVCGASPPWCFAPLGLRPDVRLRPVTHCN
ncbi:hypothetical protein MTP99_006168 [Tenebrio molitor]|nr:hypothetical protein MTP99_006168 [Tenebrio molitor]